MVDGFQLIRFKPIGRVESFLGKDSVLDRFQLIRFKPIGREAFCITPPIPALKFPTNPI